ncbi:MAG: hypothetical protein ACRDYU_16800 [Actinomycetes bacterium]
MLLAAALCPSPPLLVPEVAAGAATELDGMRTACDAAVGQMLDVGVGRVTVVGPGPRATFESGAAGSLGPYGVDVRVALGPDAGGPAALPLSLTLGAWLLARAGWSGAVDAHAVPEEATPDECAALGRRLAGVEPGLGLLVLGDGSARRSLQAPGYLDPRAEAFDASVSRALADGDPEALLGIDPALARALLAVGRPAWQVLAGASRGSGTTSSRHRAELLHEASPYGVGYLVAVWCRPD